MTEVLHIYAAVKSGRERAQTRHFCNLAYPGPGLEERFFSRNPRSQAGKNLNRNVFDILLLSLTCWQECEGYIIAAEI